MTNWLARYLPLYNLDGAGSGGSSGSDGGQGTGQQGGQRQDSGGSSSQGNTGSNSGSSSGQNGGQASGQQGAGQTNQQGSQGQDGAQGSQGGQSGTGQRQTIAGGAPNDTAVTATAKFPENWRDQIAGDDKAALERLKRFNTPADIFKSFRELETKVSSGELKRVAAAPANATPEQLATWKKEQGLPENAAAYVAGLQLPNGIVPGEADKPLLDSFAAAAEKANMSPEVYNQAVGWYYQMQDNLQAQQQQRDGEFFRDSTIALTQEWGKEFEKNQNIVGNVLAMFPKEFSDAMLVARLPDGRVLGDHPMFNQVLARLGTDLNLTSTNLPPNAGGTLQAVDTRIKEIEGIMRTNPDQYWKGEGGAALQSEVRDLYARRERMNQQRGAA